VAYLERYYDLAFAEYSTSYRRIDHYHIARDPDLDRIRDDPRFQELLSRFAATGWLNILKRHGDYEAVASPRPRFIYVDADWEGLPELKSKYDLEAIAGPGNDVSRILNLMSWVHDTVRHDGNSGEPEDRHADALIQYSREEDRGLNCWMLATILNEACLAMGYRSRIVSCYPQGDPSITHEWHVIDEVYAPSLDQWIWVDPALDTWVEDEHGNLLGIAEVRRRLVAGLPVCASPDLNWNGEPYDGGSDRYLHDYMAKNLFRIAIPLFSMPAYEMIPRKARIYVELLPAGYNPRHVRFHEITGASSSTIYTTDDVQFWAVPAGME
jgi:hypothetical protein